MNWKTINDTVEDRTMIKTHKCMKTGMPPMKYNKLTENRNQEQIENNMITDQQTRAGEKYNKIPNFIRKLPISKFKTISNLQKIQISNFKIQNQN